MAQMQIVLKVSRYHAQTMESQKPQNLLHFRAFSQMFMRKSNALLAPRLANGINTETFWLHKINLPWAYWHQLAALNNLESWCMVKGTRTNAKKVA